MSKLKLSEIEADFTKAFWGTQLLFASGMQKCQLLPCGQATFGAARVSHSLNHKDAALEDLPDVHITEQ